MNGGGFNNPLGRLRTMGFVTGFDQIEITPDGMKEVEGTYDALPTGDALQVYWLNHLAGPESKILRELIAAYPDSLTKAELAERAGYNPSGGGFNNPLGRLRTMQLVEGYAEIKATKYLF